MIDQSAILQGVILGSAADHGEQTESLPGTIKEQTKHQVSTDTYRNHDRLIEKGQPEVECEVDNHVFDLRTGRNS